MKTITDLRTGVEILKATSFSEWCRIERAMCGVIQTVKPTDRERPGIYRTRRLAAMYGERSN